MSTLQPKMKIREGGFSVVGRGAGGTKYYQVGSVAPSSERNELRVVVNGHENLVRALFFAAYRLSEELAHGPNTASVQVAHSDEPPAMLSAQDIELASPEGLDARGLREIYEALGVHSFSDIVAAYGTNEHPLAPGLHTQGLGIAAMSAYKRWNAAQAGPMVAQP